MGTAIFNKAEFNSVEEIGYRLKAYRLSQPHDMQNIAKLTKDAIGITNQSYTRVEEGGGSLQAVSRSLELFNITTTIQAVYQNMTTELSILDLHEYIKGILDNPAVSSGEIAQKIGSPHASISAFKKAQSTRLNTIQRYANALGITFTIIMKDKENKPIIPSQILVKPLLDSLKKAYHASSMSAEDYTYGDFKLGKDMKALREKNKFSKSHVAKLAGITESSVVKVEENRALLSSSEKIANALQKKLVIIIEGKEFSPQEVPAALDRLRISQKISVSDFARTIGTTYRAVKVFAVSEPTIASVNRYATGLKVKIKHRLD